MLKRCISFVLLVVIMFTAFTRFFMPERAALGFTAKQNIDTFIHDTAQKILKTVTNPAVDAVFGEWAVIGLARSDFDVPASYYETYYQNLVRLLSENGGVLHRIKYTEYSRAIIALSAMGKDPTNVGGYNLLERLCEFENLGKQGINGPAYALIALDTKDYELPKCTLPEGISMSSRERLIDQILSSQHDDGGFALDYEKSAPSDPDITAMVLQALARYSSRADVAAVIDRALLFLSSAQTERGQFESESLISAESSAQVVIALCELGIDPDRDARFIKNGNSALSGLMEFYLEGGGFCHLLGSDFDVMATNQGMCALAAYDRFLQGKNSLFKMGQEIARPAVPDALDISAAVSVKTVSLDNEKATEITFDEEKFESVVLGAKDQSSVMLAALPGCSALNVRLGARSILALKEKCSTLIFATDDFWCLLPAGSIDTRSVLPKTDALSVMFDFHISKTDDDTAAQIDAGAKSMGAGITVPPFTFKVTAAVDDKTVDAGEFTDYVLLRLRLSEDVKASDVSAAIAKNSDGSVRPLPAKLVMLEDDTYLEAKTLTDCSLAGAYADKSFDDMTAHWAYGYVRDLAGRLILSGTSDKNYDPDRSVSRAEFTTMMVKALGIEPVGGKVFLDVSENDWHYAYVASAVRHGLMKGKDNITFDPISAITREEAAAVIAGAARMVGMDTDISEAEVRLQLEKFIDSDQCSDWSRPAVAFNLANGFIVGSDGRIRPSDTITRAEMAVILQRFLYGAGLID